MCLNAPNYDAYGHASYLVKMLNKFVTQGQELIFEYKDTLNQGIYKDFLDSLQKSWEDLKYMRESLTEWKPEPDWFEISDGEPLGYIKAQRKSRDKHIYKEITSDEGLIDCVSTQIRNCELIALCMMWARAGGKIGDNTRIRSGAGHFVFELQGKIPPGLKQKQFLSMWNRSDSYRNDGIHIHPDGWLEMITVTFSSDSYGGLDGKSVTDVFGDAVMSIMNDSSSDYTARETAQLARGLGIIRRDTRTQEVLGTFLQELHTRSGSSDDNGDYISLDREQLLGLITDVANGSDITAIN